MAEQPRRRTLLWPLLVALLIYVLDRVSKFFVVRYIPLGESIPVLGSFLQLTHIQNTGISFGQLPQFSSVIAILVLIVVIALVVGYRHLLTSTRWANAAVGLVLGGAVGNLTDRIVTGLQHGLDETYVVDFLQLPYWAIFNVADSAITVGGILLGVYFVFCQGRTEAHAEEEGNGGQRRTGPT